MIVPMRHATILMTERDSDRGVRRLRRAGVLHIDTDEVRSDAIDDVDARLARARRAASALGASAAKADGAPIAPAVAGQGEDPSQTVDTVVGALDRRETIRETVGHLERELAALSPWDGVAPADVRRIRDAGVALELFEVSPDVVKKLDAPDAVYVELSREKNSVRFALLGTGSAKIDLPGIPPVPLPERGFDEVDRDLVGARAKLAAVEQEIDACVPQTPSVERLVESLEAERHLLTIRDGMEVADPVRLVRGYVPTERCDALKETARRAGWGLVLEEPAEDDERVPTLTRNPKWVSIIKPVFEMLGTTPGYREKDISFFFLVFFTVFFAMIIGDAGYGAILVALVSAAAVSRARSGKTNGPGISLLFVLSIATVLWGAVTGNWFGYEPIAAEGTLLGRLVIPALDSFDPASTRMVQVICFILGTIHLTIAHAWNFLQEVRRKPVIRSFAQLGWLSMVLGLYYLVLNLVLVPFDQPPTGPFAFLVDTSFPQVSLYMVVAGLAFVFLFGEQGDDGFLRGFLRGLGNFIPNALDGVSAFSDIISYIRLYAVGLASVEIAKSFNAMGIPAMENGLGGIIGGALILLLGHTLNLAMGGLSVVVHGVRLNVLEFSGHANVEWAGRPYEPFTGDEQDEKAVGSPAPAVAGGR